MSDGIKAYYEELEEQAHQARKQKFTEASFKHFQCISDALESLEHFASTEPSLTKHQHALVDRSLIKLRDCFKVKE